jgi:putative ABC transport system permease protein
MSVLSGLRARLRALRNPDVSDRELGEEISFHIALETEKNVRLGMSPRDAHRLAVAHFGGVQRAREEHRDVRRVQWADDFTGDVRFALRSLRRTPALAGAAIVTLALGIGANVAIFSAVNAVVLQPLPFPAQDRLVTVTEENPEKRWHLQLAAAANMLDWRAGVADFQDVMGYFQGAARATLTGRGDPQPISTSYVTGNFFSTLGVRATLGQTFTFDETFASKTHVAVLSDRAWRERFGGDSSIVGKSITVNGNSFLVIGVAPRGFSYPVEGIDMWRTLEWTEKERADIGFRRGHGLRVVARLKPGATLAHADAQLQAVVERLKREYPATNRYMGAAIMPLHDFLVGDTRLPLLVLLTSVAFLLLIACANVGNLLLVQAAGRAREAALRLALGAGRARLVRQALTESLVLSVVGGAFGLAVGWAGTRALVRLQPERMLRVHDFGVDAAVLWYVLGITLASGLIFGVAPALWSRHRDPAESLKDGGRGAAQGKRTKRWGEILVVGEVALALLMTVGAGLLVRSFMKVRQVEPGFDPHGVFAATVGLNHSYDTDDKQDAFMTQLEERARAIPGVTSSALAMNVPFTGTSYTSDYIAYGRPADKYGTEVGNAFVSPSYFATMKVPLLRGRTFGPEDRRGSTPVVVINDALAQSYFKGENPVGQRIAFEKAPSPKSTWYTIIGVVGSEHVDALDVAPIIEAYHSYVQEPEDFAFLLVRTNGDPAALTPSVRRIVHDLDPSLAVMRVTTMDALRDTSLARIRFLTTMLLAFGVIGLTLSIVGVYGVLAQSSRNRTREMGIRIALGAQAGAVRWLVVRRGLELTVAGLLIGGVVALYATRAMTRLLFGVGPTDPPTLIGVSLILAATSVVAAWIPALNASRADPASALRAD